MRIALILLLCVWGASSHAFEERTFKTPDDKALYSKLINELRCLVCQNQNIADSNADLAVDLRHEIFTMIEAGSNKSDIIDFMVQRYGEFVLYKPRFTTRTVVLWVAPFILILFGIFVIWRSATRAMRAPAELPNEAALERARRLLEEENQENK